MTDRYFENFPLIEYNGVLALDITRNVIVLNSIYSNPNLYYIYDIQSHERADSVALKVYSDSYKSWILYLNNKIIDPYYDWYIDQDTFNQYIIKKYGSIEKAMKTIKFYRNNWYSESTMLTSNQFEALTSTSKTYYTPVYGESYEITLLGYKRKREDKTISTNAVISYSVANGVGFSTLDRVKIYHSSNTVDLCSAQVLRANSTVITLQHILGAPTVNNSPTWSIVNTESNTNANTITTTSVSIANNILDGESIFWSPVYNYDYENELNEKNKSIAILKPEFTTGIAIELRDRLQHDII